MSFDADKIYDLLPAVHRTRDAEQGYPLRQLIEVIAGQVAVLEDDLEQLYDNHFVETAAPWALPYLGDLLGIRGLPAGAMARSPRAEVGHTVAYRRRKGTAPMLELLARDITGWPARAVEFFERLAATQHLNHLRPHCQSFASLRNAEALEFVGTPFEPLMRTVEVRRVEPGRGKWNIPNVGLFLWRLRSYARTASPLVRAALSDADPLADRRFRIHPFGLDAQLYLRPITEVDVTQLAEPINVSLPITRRMLAGAPERFAPLETLYGSGLSVSLATFVEGAVVNSEFVEPHYDEIPAARIVVCDLSDVEGTTPTTWNHQNKVFPDGAGQPVYDAAIDPVLGRVVFGTAPDASHLPRVTFHYGFSFDLGGGEYPRAGSFEADVPATAQLPDNPRATLPSFDKIADALNSQEAAAGAIEITDSGRYVDELPDLDANGVAREIRAVDGSCPAVVLRTKNAGQPWTIRGDAQGSVSLNGLWLIWPRDLAPLPAANPVAALRVTGALQSVKLRHCTLAPEWFSHPPDGKLISAPAAYLEISSSGIQATIENCVLPPLRVGEDSVRVHLRNCIIDAGAEDKFALSDLTAQGPAGSWRLENCTVIGKVSLDALELASNCIFFGESVFVRRRQEGCLRFSWLPNNAQTRTPRRYQCLPTTSGENAGVRPQFASLRWGDAAYAQLSQRCPAAIRTGADDGAELGAFHDLFQPQRELHLRSRLAEYLRFGLEAGVCYES